VNGSDHEAEIEPRLLLVHFIREVLTLTSHLGVKHIDMPISPWKIWKILKEKGISE
jgi:hypothetical protein